MSTLHILNIQKQPKKNASRSQNAEMTEIRIVGTRLNAGFTNIMLPRQKKSLQTANLQAFLIGSHSGYKRRGWDSNPRALADKRFSRPPRYDHFDTSPYSVNCRLHGEKYCIISTAEMSIIFCLHKPLPSKKSADFRYFGWQTVCKTAYKL